jgi:hypothetical protein
MRRIPGTGAIIAFALPGLLLLPTGEAVGGVSARTETASAWRVDVSRHYGQPTNASGYSAVVALSRRDAWAFGGTNPGGRSVPVAQHWNGNRWRPSVLPSGLTGFISDASGRSARDVWAISDYGKYVLHWSGVHWRAVKHWRGQGQLTGLTALSKDDVWVFGTTATGEQGIGSWHFNGRHWARASSRAKDIYRASALSAHDIWAIAASPRRDWIERFNGHTWRRVRIGRVLAHTRLQDIRVVAKDSVWLDGNLPAAHGYGRLVLAHWNGSRWTRLTTRWHALAGRLAGDGHGGMWVTAMTATRAMVLHLGRHWHLVESALRPSQDSGVSDLAVIPGTDSLWATGGLLVGRGGNAVIFARGQTHWRADIVASPHHGARRAADRDADSGSDSRQ